MSSGQDSPSRLQPSRLSRLRRAATHASNATQGDSNPDPKPAIPDTGSEPTAPSLSLAESSGSTLGETLVPAATTASAAASKHKDISGAVTAWRQRFNTESTRPNGFLYRLSFASGKVFTASMIDSILYQSIRPEKSSIIEVSDGTRGKREADHAKVVARTQTSLTFPLRSFAVSWAVRPPIPSSRYADSVQAISLCFWRGVPECLPVISRKTHVKHFLPHSAASFGRPRACGTKHQGLWRFVPLLHPQQTLRPNG